MDDHSLGFSLLGGVVAVLSMAWAGSSGFGAGIALIVAIVFGVCFIAGKVIDNDELRGFGRGGLVVFAVFSLLALLLFGACFALIGSSSFG